MIGRWSTPFIFHEILNFEWILQICKFNLAMHPYDKKVEIKSWPDFILQLFNMSHDDTTGRVTWYTFRVWQNGKYLFFYISLVRDIVVTFDCSVYHDIYNLIVCHI